MRILLLLFLAACLMPLSAQVQDDFSDGNLSANPAWGGETGLFEVTNGELQSNGPAATDTLYISTASTRLASTEWRLYMRYDQAPSTSNFPRFYLVSDQADLEGPLNGYFVQAGESGSADSYDLFRQTGSSVVKIIDGTAGRAANEIDAIVRVLRDAAGNWTLYSDVERSGTFALEGSVLDNTHAGAAFTGIWLKHSSTRNRSFFFDDLYIGNPIVDSQPPSLLSAAALSATQVRAVFSEPLSAASASSPSNYLILPGIGAPILAQPEAGNPSAVTLSLPSSLANNTQYQLQASGIADLAGNVMPAQQVADFAYVVFDQAAPADIRIHEIMADPTPSAGLPDAEYLELHNRSGKTLNLAGWKLSNGTTVSTLPSFILAPGSYVALCPQALAGALAAFGPSLGLASWPALVNSGDNLGLRSPQGLLIDSVDYLQSWYQDPAKDDGGYSLEMIDPDNLSCAPRSNWQASRSPVGGTPGDANSLAGLPQDQTPPSLLSVAPLGSDTLRLCFDGSLDTASLSGPGKFFVNNQIGQPLRVIPEAPDFACVKLLLEEQLTPSILYEVTVSDIADCSGNLLTAPLTASFLIGLPPEPGDIVINELLPDPDPRRSLPDGEFVEIYNRTTKALDLSGCSLSDGGSPAVIEAGVIGPQGYVILCSEADAAAFSAFGPAISISSFPSLNNSGDPVFFFDANGFPLDFVAYTDDWYRNSDKSDGGWTLERIDPNFLNCNQPGNWNASVNGNGGTPGAPNSVLGVYEDTDAPLVAGIALPDAATIELRFSEPMDEASLGRLSHYSLESLGAPIAAESFPPDFSTLRLTFLPLDSGQIYTLEIDSLRDCAGNFLRASLFVGLPDSALPGDVLINEILFNPYTGGFDFVEIANVSEKMLDLGDLNIGEIFPNSDSIFNFDRVSPAGSLFLPGSLVCLTPSEAYHRRTYLPPSTARFFEMSSFPSYDDSKGECVIFTDNGEILDRFYYEDGYHYPTLADEEGVSLERISLRRPTGDRSNWLSAASTARYATPGYPNSQALEVSDENQSVSLQPQTFSPNGDGSDDVLAINYQFSFNGANAVVSVFDAQGRRIRDLASNLLLGTKASTIFWDGTDAQGTRADVGMYVIVFEVFNQETGVRQAYRKVAVLADVLR
jgi:hypothetical protein